MIHIAVKLIVLNEVVLERNPYIAFGRIGFNFVSIFVINSNIKGIPPGDVLAVSAHLVNHIAS